MNTIQLAIQRGPNLDPSFHHPSCPLLFRNHDEITTLDDCPFPLKTDSFEVLAFGRNLRKGEPGKRDESQDTFAVVRYTKICGHTVEERITFQEGVEDFDHYGTPFIGKDYSINNWEKRIEFFRTSLPCDICQHLSNAIWHREMGDGARSKEKAISDFLLILNANWPNWKSFIDKEKSISAIHSTKWRVDYGKAKTSKERLAIVKACQA